MNGGILFLLALEDFVEGGQQEQGQERGTDKSADDDGGKRLLDFAARPGGEKHRHKAERGNAGGDEHGARSRIAPLMTASSTFMPSRRSSLK